MLGKALQFAAVRRMGAIPLAVVLIFGGFSAPLVASTRVAELEENSASKIRVEELSLGHRTGAQRQCGPSRAGSRRRSRFCRRNCLDIRNIQFSIVSAAIVCRTDFSLRLRADFAPAFPVCT
jgi:hypothetical protein